MQREYRLRENRDFRRVFQRGKSSATGRLVLYWLEKREGHLRAGISVSRKVGNAVVRNQIKRRLRASLSMVLEELRERPVDVVLVCRPPAADATFWELHGDLLKLLKRAKLMV
ncbi:ribonuclease P protein component [Alicyclobacillus sp.]|uniref:ribonuclease P protein component n=1 Tax=Alicyclobacillus sp. TaxID=61169 RepID=UPI0025BF8979|nr:ribonuclease P protein component [Alicyclobacillus sp.]MCL6515999.1 ribonuclease P protein component [Alicyclobacillus sp.]